MAIATTTSSRCPRAASSVYAPVRCKGARIVARCSTRGEAPEPRYLPVCSSVGRRLLLGAGLASGLIAQNPTEAQALMNPVDIAKRQGEVRRTEEEWKEMLGPAYNILRKEGTERPWGSPLNNEKRAGTFVCAGCAAPLYNSSMKYNSGTGWPSFYDALPGAVDLVPDLSIPFMPRTEVRCHRCQGHLGHVFDDGPRPTGQRYCMNGLAMTFVPDTA